MIFLQTLNRGSERLCTASPVRRPLISPFRSIGALQVIQKVMLPQAVRSLALSRDGEPGLFRMDTVTGANHVVPQLNSCNSNGLALPPVLLTPGPGH